MKVLVAVDDSDGSRHALAWVLDHLFPAAEQLEEEPQPPPALVLVHAQEPLRHVMMYPVGPGSAVYGAPSMMEWVRVAQAENARNLLDRAKQICHRRGVSAEGVVAQGDPREALCRAAEDMGAGLLVVGSRGLGAIERVFLGSVSDYCAHHASCPIMVVKPPRDDLISGLRFSVLGNKQGQDQYHSCRLDRSYYLSLFSSCHPFSSARPCSLWS